MANGTSGGDRWGSRIGVILAVAGSAVGLGNFLRFPGKAFENGGGAFMLPYFISLIVLGIPLCWAEWTMGRYGGVRGFNSAPGIFRVVGKSRFAMYCGALALLVPLVIYMYYVLIESWCLNYAISYLNGDLMIGAGGRIDGLIEKIGAEANAPATQQEIRAAAFGAFFNESVGAEKHGVAVDGPAAWWAAVVAGVFALNFFLIYRGVSKGIETLCKIAMPLMLVLGLIVLFRVLTLSPPPDHPERTVIAGLGKMWNPDATALLEPRTWLEASGQIFFSLSVGFGVIINYASYLRKNDDVVLSGLTSSAVNEFFEVCLGGMITLTAAFLFLGASIGGGTFSLGFVTLPHVFTEMPGGRVIGFLWFFMLFLAAITSSVSMLQPVIAFLEEGFGLKRHASVALLGLVTALGTGFVMLVSKGLVALDTLDFWTGTVFICLLATVQSILYGWVLGINRGEAEAHQGAHLRIPRFVQYVLKFVTPLYLIAILVGFCTMQLGGYLAALQKDPAALISVGFLAVVLVFLVILVHVAGVRWEQQGRFADPAAPDAGKE